MFDIRIRRGDGLVEYFLIATRKTFIVNKEVSHGGILSGPDYDQDAVIVDVGRANDIVKIVGDTFRTPRTVNFNGANVTFPGAANLEDAFKNWWRFTTDPLSGAGMPILRENSSTCWQGYFGDCRITEKADLPDSIEFEIEFSITRSIACP